MLRSHLSKLAVQHTQGNCNSCSKSQNRKGLSHQSQNVGQTNVPVEVIAMFNGEKSLCRWDCKGKAITCTHHTVNGSKRYQYIGSLWGNSPKCTPSIELGITVDRGAEFFAETLLL